jgi:hypothetical protein
MDKLPFEPVQEKIETNLERSPKSTTQKCLELSAAISEDLLDFKTDAKLDNEYYSKYLKEQFIGMVIDRNYFAGFDEQDDPKPVIKAVDQIFKQETGYRLSTFDWFDLVMYGLEFEKNSDRFMGKLISQKKFFASQKLELGDYVFNYWTNVDEKYKLPEFDQEHPEEFTKTDTIYQSILGKVEENFQDLQLNYRQFQKNSHPYNLFKSEQEENLKKLLTKTPHLNAKQCQILATVYRDVLVINGWENQHIRETLDEILDPETAFTVGTDLLPSDLLAVRQSLGLPDRFEYRNEKEFWQF